MSALSSRIQVIVNNRPDAVYFSSLDVLVFRNLAAISSIFKGIDTLFKEATDEDVEKFLSQSFVNLCSGYDRQKVSKPNRKRIALAMDTLSKMSEQERLSILSYINKYCEGKLEVNEDDKKVKLSKDEDLKLLIYGIEQRFYTTPFGNEKRLANSVQTVD